MKKIILWALMCFLSANIYAQGNSDSAAYQAQRKHINDMLDARTQKFGQYDKSLSEHTGIFGLQTKKDIRRSNDILMDIVKTDDELYKQIKILLDYKTFQQTQVLEKLNKSKEIETYNIGFMNTINKLRAENEKLKVQADDTIKTQQKATRNFIIIVVLMLVSILLLLRSKYAAKN
ncbi:MAG TPA: hypothetical protein VGC01_04060 [Mucilaginibacter sp.]